MTMRVAVIGGGPAGLMAADVLAAAGQPVDVYDAMPSVGRKFLMAGKGGMNITHAEAFDDFCARYGDAQAVLAPLLKRFGPEAVRTWMHDLGIDSLVGSSRRVFPVGMKAAPLLRAWLHRLRQSGVRVHVRHRWTALDALETGGYRLGFSTPEGEQQHEANAVIFALGGGSWARLGSDGAWMAPFARLRIATAPLRPANCGFDCNWSALLRERFAGQPLKNIAACVAGADGLSAGDWRRGEIMVTATGIEGTLVYAFSAPLRDTLAAHGQATLLIDLQPQHDHDAVIAAVTRPRGSRSLASHLQGTLGLKGLKMALLHECLPKAVLADPAALGAAIKALPLRLDASRPLDEAISSAGGVRFDAVDAQLMLKRYQGLFCAGEMLDWEAPTGGYLLTACLSTGHAAGQGALAWLQSGHHHPPTSP
ncbi:TIGR03862 family flavoprotein [uncultured Propionivibrio sp.]|uniref:TIGR03862 family flavoprotein n=1 Tax=uncultured Propionivibrio sp. TaxID=426737 RepID=UPI0029C0879E|nr:TIGR03862 family flavoprotein [uncultured Propionivibrio sp.]